MGKTEPPKPWKERKAGIRHRWAIPIIFVEWNCEKLSYKLGKWAFLEILEQLGRLTILVGIVFYIMEADQRKQAKEDQRKAKHYQAWQTINSAYAQPGSGGRPDALQDLNKDGVSLDYIDISGANLNEIDLGYAKLSRANLSETALWTANLSGANLIEANLSNAYIAAATLIDTDLDKAILVEANLSDASLAEARLFKADLSRAILEDVKLSNANLVDANLTEADLRGANLDGATLGRANLSRANLSGANLSGADLWGANLTSTYLNYADLKRVNLKRVDLTYSNLGGIRNWEKIKNIKNTNIYGVKHPPKGFVEWAKENGAVSFENHNEWDSFIDKQNSTDKSGQVSEQNPENRNRNKAR